MTAETIRKWSERVEQQHPEYYEKAATLILYEIAAQLAELNESVKATMKEARRG